MGILDRYIFRGILINVMYLVTISASISWIIHASKYLKILINHSISPLAVLQLTLLLVPSVLIYVIPFTFCVGAVLFYKQFSDTNELKILPMLGVKSFYKPLGACALLMTFVQVGIQLITPIATKEFFIRETEMRKQISLKIFSPRKFNLHQGAMIFFQYREGYKIFDLFLSYKNSFISAKSAILKYDPKKGYHLIIHNGTTVDDSGEQRTRVSFDKMEYNIGAIAPQIPKTYKLMSHTMPDLLNLYTYEARYEFVSQWIRFSLPLLNSVAIYLFLFVIPVSAPFLWASLGASVLNAVMITLGKVLVYLV